MYAFFHVKPFKISRIRALPCLPETLEGMLETLSILLEKQGRSQAAPLAAGV